MSDTDHSILAPSSAARAVQCPGSVLAEQLPDSLPDDEGEEAQKGTAAHWAGAEMLSGVIPQVGHRAPNGVVLTPEVLDAAELWADDVHRVAREFGVAFEHIDVEKRVRIPEVHPEHGWGALDSRLWAIAKDGPHLFLWDFKFGFRFVDEYENWQLMDYVNGTLSERPGIEPERVTVHMRIVQPRAYGHAPIREWTVNARFLQAYFNIRKNAADEALEPNPRFKPGAECRDCKARPNCVALRESGHGVMDVFTRAQPHGLPPEQIGWELKYVRHALQILKSVESGLEQQADVLIRRGQRIPGVRMQTGEGRTTWALPAAQAIEMAKMMGVDIAAPAEAITPLQAMKKGLPETFVKGLSKAGPGKTSVAIDDGDLARRIGFGR